MLNTSPIPRTWQEFIWLTLVAVLGYFASHLPSLFRRKPTSLEADKARAEIRNLDAESVAQTSGFVVDLMKVSAQATLDVERLRRRADFLESRLEQVEAERDLLQLQLDRTIQIGKPE